MSQINQSPSRIAADPEPVRGGYHAKSATALSHPPPQARREFDAALHRAGRHGGSDDEPHAAEEDHHKADGAGNPLAALLPMPASPAASASPAEADAPGASAAAAALLAQPTGALPDAVPTLAGQQQAGVSAGQQWRVSVPLDAQSNTAIGMRLLNTGAGHWQLRLATDTQTRQQLAPHIDRLRSKLRHRSKGKFDDLGFDDDNAA